MKALKKFTVEFENEVELMLIRDAVTEYWHNQIKFSKNDKIRNSVQEMKEQFKAMVLK